jgi:hypothetical protein
VRIAEGGLQKSDCKSQFDVPAAVCNFVQFWPSVF